MKLNFNRDYPGDHALSRILCDVGCLKFVISQWGTIQELGTSVQSALLVFILVVLGLPVLALPIRDIRALADASGILQRLR